MDDRWPPERNDPQPSWNPPGQQSPAWTEPGGTPSAGEQGWQSDQNQQTWPSDQNQQAWQGQQQTQQQGWQSGGTGYADGQGQGWGQPPPSPGYDYGYAPPQKPQTEGTAIGALICAIGTFFIPFIPGIVAFILASQASRKIRESRGMLTGQGLVTGARVVASIGLVLTLIGTVITIWIVVRASDEIIEAATSTTVAPAPGAATTVPGGAATPTTAPGAAPPAAGGQVSSLDLQVGQCFQDPGTDQIDTVEVVDCAVPHYGEVAAIAIIPNGPFPGDPAIQQQAETDCFAAFQSYVGIPWEQSRYGLTWVTPSEGSWAEGDRFITCVITPPQGTPLVPGSAQGSLQ